MHRDLLIYSADFVLSRKPKRSQISRVVGMNNSISLGQ
jgi:hypothetical protein